MNAIGLSQRILPPNPYGERYDGLDPRWHRFLFDCGLVGVPLPNDPATAAANAAALGLAGVLLTGGEDLAGYGGDSARRDDTERALLEWARDTGRPVLGVCRGMQLILDAYGSRLVPVDDHVAVEHEVVIDGTPRMINCYHRWGALDVAPPLVALGRKGTVVEAVRHADARVHGIMWHPERRADSDPERRADATATREFFSGSPR